MVFAILLLPMAKEFDTTVSALTLAVTMCMFTTALSFPIVGKLTDRYGPRVVLLTGGSVAAASTLLLAFSTSIWQVYVLYGCLFGFTWNSCGLVSSTALVSRSFAERKGVALTVFQMAFPLGWLFIIPLGQEINLTYGWRNSWLVLGAALLLILGISTCYLKEPEKAEGRQMRFKMNAMRLRVSVTTGFFLMIGVIIQFICGFTDIPLTTHWIPLSLEWGVDAVPASFALSSLAAMMLLGTASLGFVQDRIGKKIPYTASYVVRTAAMIIPLLAMSNATYYSFVALLGFSFFGMVPIYSTWLADVFGEGSVGSLLGIATLIHSIGAGLGIYVFSLSADISGSYRPALILSAIMALISVACCLTAGRVERNARTR
jgi:MFS family permease